MPEWMFDFQSRFRSIRKSTEPAQLCVLISPTGLLRRQLWSRNSIPIKSMKLGSRYLPMTLRPIHSRFSQARNLRRFRSRFEFLRILKKKAQFYLSAQKHLDPCWFLLVRRDTILVFTGLI